MACTSHVIQLAAVHGGYNFSAYVTHKRPITPSASLVTCLVVWNGKLYRFQKEVNAPSLIAALDSFLKFLDKYSYTNVILIGHHKKKFLIVLCFSDLLNYVLWYQIFQKGWKTVISNIRSNPYSYSQQILVSRLLGCAYGYGTHDTLEDI